LKILTSSKKEPRLRPSRNNLSWKKIVSAKKTKARTVVYMEDSRLTLKF
jgi:hypothetical protein